MTDPRDLPPGVHELVLNKPYYAEIEGRATVKLFNAETGKLEDLRESSNFLGTINDDYIEWMQRERYFRFAPNRGTSKYSRMPTDGMQHHIVCYTDTRPEPTNPSTQRHFEGDLVAYANRGTYIGTDTKRGSLNLSETQVTNTAVTWTFDWPTNAGNSTTGFSTIGWSRLFELTNDAAQNAAFTSLAVPGTNVPSNFGSTISGIAYDGTHWYLLNSNFNSTANSRVPKKEIYKVLPNGQLVGTLTYTHNMTNIGSNLFAQATGLAWDGTNFWHGEAYQNSTTAASGRLWLAPGGGGAGTLYSVPNCGPITGVAFDGSISGGRLYLLDPHNNKIHRTASVGAGLNPSSVEIEQVFTISGMFGTIASADSSPYYCGLAHEGDNSAIRMWVMNGQPNTTFSQVPGGLLRIDGNGNNVSRSTNGARFTQNQAGLVYGTNTVSTEFGATNQAFARTSETTYTTSHSTADNSSGTASTANPWGALCFANGKLHAVTDDRSIRVLEPWSLGTRVKQSAAVPKAMTQTMKITYGFTWV